MPAPRPPVSSRGQLAPPAAPPELSKPTRLARTAPRLSSRSRPSPRHHAPSRNRLGGSDPNPTRLRPRRADRSPPAGRPARARSLALPVRRGGLERQVHAHAGRQAPWRANKRYRRTDPPAYSVIGQPCTPRLVRGFTARRKEPGWSPEQPPPPSCRAVRTGGSCSVARQVFRHRTPTWILELEYARHHQHRELIMQGAQRSTIIFLLFLKKTAECVTTNFSTCFIFYQTVSPEGISLA